MKFFVTKLFQLLRIYRTCEEVYDEIFRLSDEEEHCYRYFMDRKVCVPKICYIVMNKHDSETY